MKPIETLDEIAKLLNRLEGVNVIDLYITKTRVSIKLTIESHKSHHWLVYCAMAANIRFNSNLRHNPGAKEIMNNPALGLVYDFDIRKVEREDEEFESIGWLGAHLVWLMYKMKEIETDDANRLLNIWNAFNVKEAS